jgi:hypothetical protein
MVVPLVHNRFSTLQMFTTFNCYGPIGGHLGGLVDIANNMASVNGWKPSFEARLSGSTSHCLQHIRPVKLKLGIPVQSWAKCDICFEPLEKFSPRMTQNNILYPASTNGLSERKNATIQQRNTAVLLQSTDESKITINRPMTFIINSSLPTTVCPPGALFCYPRLK